MRVTESRLLEIGTAGVSDARAKLSRAGQVLQSGVRVQAPSDDVAAWAAGARAAARQTLSEARGAGITRARENLNDVDTALGQIGDSLSRLRETTLQAANGTLTAADRAGFVELVNSLRATALGAANSRGVDGEYLLAGSKGDAAPFDAAGVYRGDSVDRPIEAGEGTAAVSSHNGDMLKDLAPIFDKVNAALTASDVPGLQAALLDIGKAIDTVASSRTSVGGRLEALDAADDARSSFELSLADAHARAVEADPVAAASELARASATLEAAKASASEILSALRSR